MMLKKELFKLLWKQITQSFCSSIIGESGTRKKSH